MNENIGKEASKGGKARAKKLNKKRRKEIARKGGYSRWIKRDANKA